MTHAELVKRAARWLRNTMNCGVVLVEHGGGLEIHDAIGWKRGLQSILVECKVSREDFRADFKKNSRVACMANVEDRPAAHCYYMMPKSLGVLAFDVPDPWGLLLVGDDSDIVRIVKPIPEALREIDTRSRHVLRNELHQLYREVRRYQLHGITYPPITKHLERSDRMNLRGAKRP